MSNKLKTKEVIGQALIFWRKKTGKNQIEISAYLGIKTPMYRAYEYQNAEPSIVILKKLANLYGLNKIEDMIDFSQLV